MVRSIGNFIHNNIGGFGYGVATSRGFPLIESTVLFRNKYSITSDAASRA